MPVITALQAPVPQAKVSPHPLSNVLIYNNLCLFNEYRNI